MVIETQGHCHISDWHTFKQHAAAVLQFAFQNELVEGDPQISLDQPVQALGVE